MYVPIIGVGRFRILGGQGLEYWGGRGGQGLEYWGGGARFQGLEYWGARFRILGGQGGGKFPAGT